MVETGLRQSAPAEALSDYVPCHGWSYSLIIEESSPGRSLLARLDHGAEIIGQITDVARERRIRADAI